MGEPTALIGLDWGTTSFRAYRLDASGRVLEQKSAEAGILRVANGDFEGVFQREVGPWLAADQTIPVIASGMITSRQGWVEVPYCPCPAGGRELANALAAHRTGSGTVIHFVPGLSITGADDVPDVIRGEETQIVGEISSGPAASAGDRRMVVLPGTHSKWALVEDQRIVWFATFMTGELYAVLKDHSILGRLMAGDGFDPSGFARGLAYARTGAGGLLQRLFSARTLGLFDRLEAGAVGSYLSGLLIGTEIAEARGYLDQRKGPVDITVIGASGLTERYLDAIEATGQHGRRAADDVVALGLHLIARTAGLVG